MTVISSPPGGGGVPCVSWLLAAAATLFATRIIPDIFVIFWFVRAGAVVGVSVAFVLGGLALTLTSSVCSFAVIAAAYSQLSKARWEQSEVVMRRVLVLAVVGAACSGVAALASTLWVCKVVKLKEKLLGFDCTEFTSNAAAVSSSECREHKEEFLDTWPGRVACGAVSLSLACTALSVFLCAASVAHRGGRELRALRRSRQCSLRPEPSGSFTSGQWDSASSKGPSLSTIDLSEMASQNDFLRSLSLGGQAPGAEKLGCPSDTEAVSSHPAHWFAERTSSSSPPPLTEPT